MKELRLEIIRMYQNGIPMREISRFQNPPLLMILSALKKLVPMKTVQEKSCKNHKKPSTNSRNAEAEPNDQKKLFTKACQKTEDF
jgi:hypothetical protein